MYMPAQLFAPAYAVGGPTDGGNVSNEQLAAVAAQAFAKLWTVQHTHESLRQFQVFCQELLCSTQIAVPIVMLALLYVNSFRRRFPLLHGGSGSEYRMFVVALMLASKFLEDNTFTTKTWSEVSRLPAGELVIMQREFLNALEHRLHVSVNDYRTWVHQLHAMMTDDAGKGARSMALSMSPSAFAPADVRTPADTQVVPSPTALHVHELPAAELLPSPPAKRMRYAQPAAHMCPALEPIAVPPRQLMQPQIYTPPSSAGAGFAHADFTFKAPAMAALPHSAAGAYFAHPHSAGVVPVFSAAQGYLATLAASMTPASAGPTVLAFPQRQHSQIGLFGAPPPLTTRYSAFAQSSGLGQQPPQADFGLTASVAAALASNYPAMCYRAPAFAPGAAAALPIFNYGA
ncbi:hypothetical protein LPJ61_001255 [Coemansia biformis]|uniref:Cyclin N-terminal domain-containing protein n=1 Tax=Coemansia biformis TaxID=1286918 RepID=A0A9W8CZR6_9FUNG|nr:hypothetical protein LPJ61_001255 [Coemansia biformis]